MAPRGESAAAIGLTPQRGLTHAVLLLVLLFGAGLLAATLSMAALWAGGGAAGSLDSEGGGGRRVLVFSNDAEPATLDPALMTGLPELTLAAALFEGLVARDPDTLAPLPAAAEGWEVSPDGCRYTFHLRALRWSDGAPLTAADFLFAWRRILDPRQRLGAQYATLLYPIAGARSLHRGEGDDLGVAAPGARTLEVRLDAPCAHFLDLLAFATFAPVPRHVVEARGEEWTRPGHIVTNGPFRVASWAMNRELLLARNPEYRGAAGVALDAIRVLPLEDPNTAFTAFLAGEVDWIRRVPPARLEEAKRHPDYDVSLALATYFFRLNVRRPPCDDPRVREALARALDRGAICRHVLRGGEEPARSFVPPFFSALGYEGAAGLAYDPERARALLAAAGYPGGEGFPPLDLLYNTDALHRRIAENVCALWERELGIAVAPRNVEWGVYLQRLRDGDYGIAKSTWYADYVDPSTFLDIFHSGSGNNRTGWSEPRYDALIEEARRTVSRERRLALLGRAEALLCEEGIPLVPLHTPVNARMVSPALRGLARNPLDLQPFARLRLVAGGTP